MLAEERQGRILALLKARGAISATEIQRKLKVSRETVRRDLMLLAEQNKLRKTHGGAISLERSEPEITVRRVTNVEGKRSIARLAAGLIPDGASVILASGTTVQGVAEELLARNNLTVFTNCLSSCMRLSGHNGNRVFMLGGEVRTENRATLGRDATEMLSHYFADFAVIGAGAISPTGWLMDYTREEAELHGMMLRAARTATVVADHDKFGRFAPVRVESLEHATYLITDRAPDEDLAQALAGLPLEILVSEGAGP